MKTSSNKLLKGWRLGNKTQVVALFFAHTTCCFFPSLHCCYCEPTVQIESYKSLKLVRNLRGIIVLPIRVIDCLDALSGCIISLWLQPGLGSDPRAKWLKSKRNQAWGEWAEPVIYDKIQRFHYTWKSVGERFFISTCRKWKVWEEKHKMT